MAIAACTPAKPKAVANHTDWLSSGSIVIASPLPAATSPRNRAMLGFLPAGVSSRGIWLSIDTSAKRLRLMEGEKQLAAASIRELGDVEPGEYEVLHKQREALWHAPEEYFTTRRLSVPPEGDESRYLRGALGDYVLYITPETPIHDAPMWTSEIGGIHLDENDLARLYYQLPVGAVVEVQ